MGYTRFNEEELDRINKLYQKNLNATEKNNSEDTQTSTNVRNARRVIIEEVESDNETSPIDNWDEVSFDEDGNDSDDDDSNEY